MERLNTGIEQEHKRGDGISPETQTPFLDSRVSE